MNTETKHTRRGKIKHLDLCRVYSFPHLLLRRESVRPSAGPGRRTLLGDVDESWVITECCPCSGCAGKRHDQMLYSGHGDSAGLVQDDVLFIHVCTMGLTRLFTLIRRCDGVNQHADVHQSHRRHSDCRLLLMLRQQSISTWLSDMPMAPRGWTTPRQTPAGPQRMQTQWDQTGTQVEASRGPVRRRWRMTS